MPLDEDYPLTSRDLARKLRSVLEVDPELDAAARANLALILNMMADNACDLEHIFQRLVNDSLTPREIGELLIAFELTMTPLRGCAGELEGKLFDIGDRLKAIESAAPTGGALVADSH